MNRISIFVRKPVLWAQTPFFGIVGLFKDLESYHLQIWNLGSLAHYQTCEIIECFKNRFLVPGRVIIFGAIWAQTPFFGLFYLKSYDDEIWYAGTLCDLRPKAELFARRRRALCPGAKRLCYCPPKAAKGGFPFGPFGRRPKVLLAVGELFVRARSARTQARSACVIARRRRVSIRPKAEGFARRRRALCSGAKRP